LRPQKASIKHSIENQVANIKVKPFYNILLYTESSLVSKIFTAILNNLDFSIDVSIDDNDFLDKLEKNNYNYVLYENRQLGTSEGLLIEMIQETGAEPVELTLEKQYTSLEQKSLCIIPNIEEIKKTLTNIHNKRKR